MGDEKGEKGIGGVKWGKVRQKGNKSEHRIGKGVNRYEKGMRG